MSKFQTQLSNCYHVHSSNVVLEWMLVDPVDDKLVLVQVKAWGFQKKIITWSSVDQDLLHHMVSLGHNESNRYKWTA